MGMFDTDDDDDDLEIQDDRPRGDSSAMREVRRALKQAQEQNKQLQKLLSDLQEKGRGRDISDVLASKGLSNPKVAALISDLHPRDAAVTPETVTALLEKYGDVIGAAPKPQEEAPETASTLPQPSVDALRDIDAVSLGGLSAQGADDMFQRLNSANSLEEINAILRGAAG